MRCLRYSVAMSLDGYIADVDGGYDWIIMDPAIDFVAYMADFDAMIMGRGTYEVDDGSGPGFEGLAVYVVSTTLDPAAHPNVTVVSENVAAFVTELKARDGKDIWLFGGGVLFRSLIEAGLVDQVEVGVIPALLGQGIPLLPGFEGVAKLKLRACDTYPTGIVMLRYDVENGV